MLQNRFFSSQLFGRRISRGSIACALRLRNSSLLRRHVSSTAALFVLLFAAQFAAARPPAVDKFASTAAASAAQSVDHDRFPKNFVPSGKDTFKQYCAACHGLDAKGHGPAREALKIPAPDLTTLAKRHGGGFPYDYVTGVLTFGPGFTAHGSSDMPTWGPIFQYLDNYNKAAVQKRIRNLCDYLATLQEK